MFSQAFPIQTQIHCLLTCLYSPFYGEEYKFTVPRAFRHLSFYVWESCSLSRDAMLGKVAISSEELKSEPVREDRWYTIKPIDPDSEVQVSSYTLE